MFLLAVHTNGAKIFFNVSGNQTLLNILHDNNIYIPAVCGHCGTCGKCAIKLLKGSINPSDEDRIFFTKEQLEAGMRLACKANITEDVEISIYAPVDNGFEIINFYKHVSHMNPSIYKIKNLSFSNFRGSLSEYIYSCYTNKQININLLKKLSGCINNGSKEYNALVKEEKLNSTFVTTLVDVFPNEPTQCLQKAYGIAIDIGTTTICFEMLDLVNKTIISTHSRINRQRQYGADVLSRIQLASEGKLSELQSCVHRDIEDGIIQLLFNANITSENVYKIVIAANTTMIHILLGLPCRSLGVSPFNTTLTNNCIYSFYDVFGSWLCKCCVEILPAVSAFVGSDISAGMFFCGAGINDKPSLLIDLGTNGEMALFSKKRIICTSTAAGPAFEGGNISCGTGGVPGAICSVSLNGSDINYKTIGGNNPCGICGSGIIDAVACFVESGVIDETGLLSDEFFESGIEIAPDILLTQKDIRELQLAKAAVRAGIAVLLKTSEIGFKDIESVFVAGGFGYHMNTRSAILLGLIPPELECKLKAVGNSSLGGCVKALLEGNSVSEISSRAEEINLSENNLFNELFVEYMGFEHI